MKVRSCKGFSLVEVVVSVLLVGIMATSFMSIALTGKLSRGRIQHRTAATASIRRVSENLKLFVTADRNLAAGPGVAPNGWGLPGDTSGLAALDAGTHPLNATIWAPELVPAGGSLSYLVTLQNTPLGPQPTVAFNVSWED